VAVVLIITLHVGIVYAFMSGLVPKAYATFRPPMNLVPVPETPRHKDPPPLPTVNPMTRVNPINIPTPDLEFDETPAEVKDTLVLQPDPPQGTGSATIPESPPVHRVAGGFGKGFPNADDYYPADAARLGLEGTATVRSCVDPRGRLTAAPAVTKSSGTPSLDTGALRLAKAGSGYYRPSTENGQPVNSCFEFQVTFHMRKGY
jgi:TonB family protein